MESTAMEDTAMEGTAIGVGTRAVPPNGAPAVGLRVSVMLLALAAACGVAEHPERTCDDAAPCASGETCVRGFCVAQGCAVDEVQPCFDGDAEQIGLGVCRQGEQTCGMDGLFGACLGQVLPRAEECNGDDDDCDGRTDEIAGTQCDTGMPGACGAGELTCTEGGASCAPLVEPSEELCNGRDDDCDEGVDEALEGDECYPMDTDGCVAMGDGSHVCMGTCAPGTTTCVGEDEPACVGAILPAAMDGCTAGEGPARDDDCDGAIDEDCACEEGESQPCYGGPDATAGVGPCMRGTQTCEGGRFGACEGAVLPAAETCANEGVDDDCDGVMDDVPGLGEACEEPENVGVCAMGERACADGVLVCATRAPAPMEACDLADDDCDGSVDEAFDLSTDPANCGACGNGCAADCCDGGCTDVRFDEAHCGACGEACGDGEECCGGTCRTPSECAGCAEDCAADGRTCCSATCVDTETDELNCGGCGVACGDGQVCCGGTCVGSDPDHCGDACATCDGAELCCDGACVAQGPERCGSCDGGCGATCCDDGMHGGACVNTDTDVANCGGCGVDCPSGDVCSNGVCCAAGETYCGGESCTDLQTDRDNCGRCGRECQDGLIGLGREECVMGSCEPT